MFRITEEHTDFIRRDLESRGITNDLLKEDLVDHVCCILEREIKNETDFRTCYSTVITTFFRNDLSELEEESNLLLTFQKYHPMKKTMMFSGLSSASLMLTGIWFKTMHYPGAGAILPAGIVICCLVFIPLLAYLKTKEQSLPREKIATWAGAIASILLLAGMGLKVAFKSSHAVFPVMFCLSVITAVCIFLPAFFLTGLKDPSRKINTIITCIVVIMVYAMVFSMTYRSF